MRIKQTARAGILGLALMALAPEALAKGECLVSYEEFEEVVKHLDIPACPAGAAGFNIKEGEGFCRLSLEGGRAVLYGFKFEKNGACLTKAQSWPAEVFFKKFGRY